MSKAIQPQEDQIQEPCSISTVLEPNCPIVAWVSIPGHRPEEPPVSTMGFVRSTNLRPRSTLL